MFKFLGLILVNSNDKKLNFLNLLFFFFLSKPFTHDHTKIIFILNILAFLKQIVPIQKLFILISIFFKFKSNFNKFIIFNSRSNQSMSQRKFWQLWQISGTTSEHNTKIWDLALFDLSTLVSLSWMAEMRGVKLEIQAVASYSSKRLQNMIYDAYNINVFWCTVFC